MDVCFSNKNLRFKKKVDIIELNLSLKNKNLKKSRYNRVKFESKKLKPKKKQ